MVPQGRLAFLLVPLVLLLPALLLRQVLREHDGGTGEPGSPARIVRALVTAGGLSLAMVGFVRPAALPLWVDGFILGAGLGYERTDQPSMHATPAVKLGCTDCHGGDSTSPAAFFSSVRTVPLDVSCR